MSYHYIEGVKDSEDTDQTIESFLVDAPTAEKRRLYVADALSIARPQILFDEQLSDYLQEVLSDVENADEVYLSSDCYLDLLCLSFTEGRDIVFKNLQMPEKIAGILTRNNVSRYEGMDFSDVSLAILGKLPAQFKHAHRIELTFAQMSASIRDMIFEGIQNGLQGCISN